jgi:hypothetical protein
LHPFAGSLTNLVSTASWKAVFPGDKQQSGQRLETEELDLCKMQEMVLKPQIPISGTSKDWFKKRS